MDSKVNVKGDAEVVMDQNNGSITINHFYGDPKVVPAIKPELRRAISELLTICDPCGQRKLIEKISLEAFQSKEFKSLSIEQVRSLIGIAQSIADAINAARPVVEEKKAPAPAPWWKFW
jgi:hypothetical protein